MNRETINKVYDNLSASPLLQRRRWRRPGWSFNSAWSVSLPFPLKLLADAKILSWRTSGTEIDDEI